MDYITLKDLAEDLSMDRSNLRKYVVAEGIPTFEVRNLASRGQKTLAVTQENADKVRRGLSWRLKGDIPTASGVGRIVPLSPGGLDKARFDALVVRHGIPDHIAGIMHYYILQGLDASRRSGGAWAAVAEREGKALAAWVADDGN